MNAINYCELITINHCNLLDEKNAGSIIVLIKPGYFVGLGDQTITYSET